MKYFYLINIYKRGTTGHVIKARDEEHAWEIILLNDIKHKEGGTVLRRILYELDLNDRYVKRLIKRRKQGIGGKIWYEDENGKLQYEK